MRDLEVIFKSILLVIFIFCIILLLYCLFGDKTKSSNDEKFQRNRQDMIQNKIKRKTNVDKKFQIQFQVVKQVDETPLTNVLIKIIIVNEKSKNKKFQIIRTNKKGIANYYFKPPVTLKIDINKDGYMRKKAFVDVQLKENSETWINIVLLENQPDISINKGKLYKVIKIKLTGSATLFGHVIDEEENVCSGLQVSVVDIENIPSPLELYKKNLEYYSLKRKNLEVYSEIRKNASMLQLSIGKRILDWWLRGKLEVFERNYAEIPKEVITYFITQILKGYSIFEKITHDIKGERKVVTTDKKGNFVATNITLGKKIKITIFGDTSKGEKVYPYEEDVIFNKQGEYHSNFQIDRGSTIDCTFSLDNGKWETIKKDLLLIVTQYKNNDQKDMVHNYFPQQQKRRISLGPLFYSGRLIVMVRAGLNLENKTYWEGMKTIPELKPGINAINIILTRKDTIPSIKKPKGKVKIIIIDESGHRIFSDKTDVRIRGYIKDRDKFVMCKRVDKFGKDNSNHRKYYHANEEGDLELPISGDGPYMIHVEIDAATHEQSNVMLSPGDIYEFLFPEHQFSQKGNVRIRIITPGNEPIKKAEVSFIKNGHISPYKKFTGGSEISINHLKAGEYKLVTNFPENSLAAGDQYIIIKKNQTQYVEIQAYSTVAIEGRIVRNKDDSSEIRVFLSGITAKGEKYNSFSWCRRDGIFIFRKVPMGDFQLVASNKTAMFGPERLLINKLDKIYEIALEANYNGRKVEFQLKEQQGSNKSKKETSHYAIKYIEISNEDGTEIYWEKIRGKSIQIKNGIKNENNKLIGYLLPGKYQVIYCVSRMYKTDKYIKLLDDDEPYSFRKATIEVKDSLEPLCIKLK